MCIRDRLMGSETLGERERVRELGSAMDGCLEHCGGAACPEASLLWQDRLLLSAAHPPLQPAALAAILVRAGRGAQRDAAAEAAARAAELAEDEGGAERVAQVAKECARRGVPAEVQAVLERVCARACLREGRVKDKEGERALEAWAAGDAAKADHQRGEAGKRSAEQGGCRQRLREGGAGMKVWLEWEAAERAAGRHKRAAAGHAPSSSPPLITSCFRARRVPLSRAHAKLLLLRACCRVICICAAGVLARADEWEVLTVEDGGDSALAGDEDARGPCPLPPPPRPPPLSARGSWAGCRALLVLLVFHWHTRGASLQACQHGPFRCSLLLVMGHMQLRALLDTHA
eukprot:1722900-Rhodomonas_salina.2